VRVTVLIDNRLARAGLEREHGLSLWVQTGTANVVIDTGGTAAFRRNAAALGVDLATADAVALSHGHYDHSGGIRSHPAESSLRVLLPPGGGAASLFGAQGAG